MNYATDGICHNAQPGTFGHECGKPATWVGTKANGFKCGFCDQCKWSGHEARPDGNWVRTAPATVTPQVAAELAAMCLRGVPSMGKIQGGRV